MATVAAKTHPFAEQIDLALTGPGTLAGRYMRTFWQPVYRSEDLPAGRAVPIRIMSEGFTLYRGDTGAAHVLAFRCAHRGTQLSTGWVEDDNLRCFYHGWMYGPDGQCVEQPAEPEPFAQKVRIRSYPTEEYLGLIFAYFGEGEPPAMPRHAAFEGDDVLSESAASAVYPCNYFNRIDNATDMSHVTFAHFQLHYRPEAGFQPPAIRAEETDYGAMIVGDYPDASQKQEVYRFFMPNYNQFEIGTRDPAETKPRDRLSWKVPLDDGHSVNFHATRIYLSGDDAERYRLRQAEAAGAEDSDGAESPEEIAEGVLTGRIHVRELASRRDAVELEDLTTMVGQGVIADRRTERMGRSDAGVILVRKLWDRELRALAQGRPLKQWTRPGGSEAGARS